MPDNKRLWIFLPILLVFVSITSFIAGTRIGRDTDHRMGEMLDTIILSPDGETVDANRIEFSGKLNHKDGTPCANQLLELHSDPMRTTTDSDGFFYFHSVEIGEHSLLMLDENGQVQTQVTVTVGRDKGVPYGRVEQSAKQYYLTVSEQAAGLYIEIELDDSGSMTIRPDIYTRRPGEGFRDSEGREQQTGEPDAETEIEEVPESGEGLIDRENETQTAAVEGEPEGQLYESRQEDLTASSEAEATQTADMETPVSSEIIPSESASTAESRPTVSRPDSGGNSDSGGDSDRPRPTEPETTKPTEPEPTEPQPTEPEPTEPEPTEPADPLNVSVIEKGGPVWTQNTTISLFADRTGVGADRKLAPGSKGSYAFLVNNNNTYGITYRMKVTAPQGQLLIPLRYRLKSGETYLCGNSSTWLTAEELAAAAVTLKGGTQKEYLLEWQWMFDGGDDAYDTQIGMAANLEYQVIVTITIEQIIP